jgi:hypothetical protein
MSLESNSKKVIFQRRILADMILICSVFLLPYWLTAIFGIFFAFYFENYYEFLCAGLAIDFVYHIPLARYGHFQFIFSFLCALCFLVIIPLRRRLRLN